MFQRLKDSNKRYRPINQKVVSESKHTLTLANGSVLRKSGVAVKGLKPNAQKSGSQITLPPPAMSALKRRAELKQPQNEQAAGTSTQSAAEIRTREISPTRDSAEEADSDSEYEPKTISRYAGQTTVASDRGVELSAPKDSKDAEGLAENPNLSEGSGVQTMNTEQGGSGLNVRNKGQPEKQAKKTGERGRHLRLVSYSSQESEDQDGTGSRKSTRKRTAVSKFGGVMIDSIFKVRTTKGEEDRERDTI